MTKSAKHKSSAILMSKRADVFYLEHARVMQKDDRVVYLTDTDQDVEQFFNIPEKNTAFILLGRGTSITDQAARKLAESGVMLGFAGSGGSPLLSAMEPVFFSPQSEYRPTEYMQGWVRMWLDENRRLSVAKKLLELRIDWTIDAWAADGELAKRKIAVPDTIERRFRNRIEAASNTSDLLTAEAEWAKGLYALLARGYTIDFTRDTGKQSFDSPADKVNSYLDHGNYLAYGYAAVVLHTLGISFSFPLLHGKTRRGALVFDIADLFKDALVMPAAFEFGTRRRGNSDFRMHVIDKAYDDRVLDNLFDTIRKLLVAF